MLKANLGFKKVKQDINNFSLRGMIEPTFYNFGTENVRVLHTVIKPEQSFLAGVSNMVMDNDVPIVFEGNNKQGRNLICYYGSPVQEC